MADGGTVQSMTRRALLAAILVVAADLTGSRRQAHDSRRCRTLGAALSRRGLTEAERSKLERLGCKQMGDAWTSDKVYAA